ncbi:unnamed protein product [Ambrosiozyma monospora]|uniref:MICOS complex subunit MIC12 n=1 Tax=Ambrosiozyma monospora TaxID=43982 RepID=A0A9W6Z942_AMBMO|nr:unnamed protein product [Ambrosiozyma monospora]
MAGRIHGLLGGILLTTSLTYLTQQNFKKNQAIIHDSISQSVETLDYENRKVEINSNVKQLEVKTVRESVKDIWNYEIVRGVNWLYSLDFNGTFNRVVNGK